MYKNIFPAKRGMFTKVYWRFSYLFIFFKEWYVYFKFTYEN